MLAKKVGVEGSQVKPSAGEKTKGMNHIPPSRLYAMVLDFGRVEYACLVSKGKRGTGRTNAMRCDSVARAGWWLECDWHASIGMGKLGQVVQLSNTTMPTLVSPDNRPVLSEGEVVYQGAADGTVS
jgi:hypothetical protein